MSNNYSINSDWITLNRAPSTNNNNNSELEQWKQAAFKLWDLLDDIDTFGDMYKPVRTGYFKAVNKKAEQRHKILTSDGYNLTK